MYVKHYISTKAPKIWMIKIWERGPLDAKSLFSARTIDSGNAWHFKKLYIFPTNGLPCFVCYDCTSIPINGSEKSSINILLSMLDSWFSNQRLEYKNNRPN